MNKVLVAGSTGYLGGFVCSGLLARSYEVRALARNLAKLERQGLRGAEKFEADVTRPETLPGCCEGVDTVISSVGITRQRDGLSYHDVDYQANMNLLVEAKKSGVRKFIYISVLNGDRLQNLKICEAKERFVEELSRSGLEYSVVRPNGFFSDLSEFYTMAKKGRVYLFGSGEWRTNPIHGEDLATVCIDAMDRSDLEIPAGGPETMTHRDIAMLAFKVLGKDPKITSIPNWVRKSALRLIRCFCGSKVYGPIEFFMTVMAMDMVAPAFGSHTLREHFLELKKRDDFENGAK
ncbi:MAG: SDR family oxidoreductase [Puniceicoccales bacterium]